MRSYKDIEIWKDVTDEEWHDWKWQVRNRITDVDTLKQIINITEKKKRKLERYLKSLEWELLHIMHL